MSDDCIAKLLLVYAGKTTTADIVVKLMQELSKRKKIEFKAVENISVRKQDIEWSSCVIIIRGADYYLSEISKAAKKAGKFCVLYLDDDLLSLYGSREVYGRYIKKCLSFSDILWTSNRNVSEKYSIFLSERSRSVESVVIEPWKKIIPYTESDTGVGIVFAGSPAHEKNIKKYILPALRNVYKKHNDIRVYLIGYRGTDLDGIETFIKTTCWFENAADYRRYVSQINVQIGIAIIDDTEFGKCKFYNKYIEYSKLGLVGLYTNCEPYTFVVRDKENGFLVSNTIEDWTEKLLYLVENPGIRKKCTGTAQKDLLERYSTQVVIDEIAHKIPEFSNYTSISKDFVYNRKLLSVADRLNRCINLMLNPKYILNRVKQDTK